MSKWHDITPDTGDPQDLPGNGGGYIVTVGDRTCEMAFDPYDNVNVADWYRNVIAWREMPRAYVPGKRKTKPARFEHTCEVSDGQPTIARVISDVKLDAVVLTEYPEKHCRIHVVDVNHE